MSNTKFTVVDLLKLADEARAEVSAGSLDPDSEVVISLEVLNDADEGTWGNRVFGGSPVEVGVIKTPDNSNYATIHLMGSPNFDVYGGKA